jgi:quercetin dioxygenase-like cupin family protein
VIQAHVEVAAGASLCRHRHPGDEIVHVLEGALEYQLEGQSPVTLTPGDVLLIPAGTIHAAKNVGGPTVSERIPTMAHIALQAGDDQALDK